MMSQNLPERKQSLRKSENYPGRKQPLGKSGTEVVLRGFHDPNLDEEIGTFDPTVVAEQRENRGRIYAQFEPKFSRDDDHSEENFDENYDTQNSQGHLYTNPFSLAKELVESGEALEESWDVDSEPLPPYEHPAFPEVEILPPFNRNTPKNRVIRRNLGGEGALMSGICCSIQ